MNETANPEANTSPNASSPAKSVFRRVPILLRNTAFVVLLTLFVLELLLRWIGFATPVLYTRDDDTGYRLKPNQHVRFLGNEIVINGYGIRDPRPLTQRNPARKRVLVLGDSVTWGGLRIAQDQLFTSVAERSLPETEVVNAGVNGYSITQMAALYRVHLRDLEPDLVVLCVIPRNFSRPPIVRLSGEGAAFPEKSPTFALSYTVAVARQSLQDRFEWQWLNAPSAIIHEPYDEAVAEHHNFEALMSLREELSAHRLLIVFMPAGRSRINRNMRHVYQSMLSSEGIDYADAAAAVAMAPEDYMDRVHYAASGHKKVGETLSKWIHEALHAESHEERNAV